MRLTTTNSNPRIAMLSGCALALLFAVGCGSSNDSNGRLGAGGSGGDDSVGSGSNGTATNGTTGIGSTSNGSTSVGSTSNGSTSSGGTTGSGGVGGAGSGGVGGAASSSNTVGAGAGPTSTTASTGSGNPSGFDQFQVHNLDDINMYRATLNIAPIVLDQTLCTFALAGSQELTMDHMPHQHFISAGNNIWTEGFKSAAGENQGDPNGWTVLAQDPTQNELDQIDAIQKAMFDEGPGTGEAHGHYTNMMNAEYTRVGVGLIEVQVAGGMSLYLTNDFSN